MIREQIEAKLRAAFDPMYLEVVDESYRHNVPAGSESHFKVVLVSDRFTGERFLNRHRMIYGTLRMGSITGYGICFAAVPRRREYRLEIPFATAGAFPVCCLQI